MAVNRLTIDTVRSAPWLRGLVSRFFRGYRDRLSEAITDGSREGLADVMDEWKRESTDIAPLEFGTLRRGITTRIAKDKAKNEVYGEITASAIEVHNGRRFDYAVYLNDDFPGDSFENPTTPGTVPHYLDVPAKELGRKWSQMIEQAIKTEIRRRGL